MRFITSILKTTFSSLIILSGCFSSLLGQTYFNKLVDFDSSYANFSMDAVQLDSFYYVSGQSYYFTDEALTLIKLSLSGDTVWTKEYHDAPTQFQGNKIEVKDDTTIFIFGEVIPIPGGDIKLYCAQINTNGILLKDSILGENNKSYLLRDVKKVGNSFFLVSTSDDSINRKTISLLQMDINGSVVLVKEFTYGEDDFGGSIAQTSDGGFLLSGASKLQNLDHQYIIIKIDSLGNQEWIKEYGRSNEEDRTAFILDTKDSNFIISCGYEINGNNKPIGRIIKINEFGEIIWEQDIQVGNNYTSIASRFVENDDGTILCLAWTENSIGKNESTIVKLSSLGDLLWYRDYTNDSSKNQYTYGLTQTKDGGYIMTGAAIDSTQDAWIQKVDCEGCDSIQCAMQDSCIVYDCHTDSLPNAAFENQDTIRLGDTLKINNTSKFSSGYWWDIDLARHQSWVNPEYEFLDTGIYTVRLVAYNVDCRDTLEKQIVVIDSTTGMMENQSVNKNIKIYPNPTTGILSIEIKNKLKLLNVKITDVFGRELHSQSLSTSKSTLNLYDLSKGVYFVIITDNNKIAYKEKLVLMK